MFLVDCEQNEMRYRKIMEAVMRSVKEFETHGCISGSGAVLIEEVQ